MKKKEFEKKFDSTIREKGVIGETVLAAHNSKIY